MGPDVGYYFECSLISEYQYPCSGLELVERAHLAKQLLEAMPSPLTGRYDSHQIWSIDAHRIFNSVPLVDDVLTLGESFIVSKISMSTPRGRFTQEFKDRLCRAVISPSKPIKEVATAYGVGLDPLRNWLIK
jgi:hypothetical protein